MTNKFSSVRNFHGTDYTYKTEFNLNNVNTSLANSIRRILLSNIPTVAFSDENNDNPSIKIQKNTSAIHNEFLAHRLSLIPIYMDNDLLKIKTNYDKENCIRNFDFVTNKDDLPIFNISKTSKLTMSESVKVTSQDIQISNKESHSPSLYFKKDQYTDDYSCLTILKPNIFSGGNEGEELELTAYPTIGTALENSRHCPVGTVSYSFIVDDERADKMCSEKIDYKNQERIKKNIDPMNESEIIQFKNSFNLLDKQRAYYTDMYGEANQFKFVIESIGFNDSRQLLLDSFNILRLMLHDILNSIKIINKKLDFNNKKLDINDTNDSLLGYNIIIKNEDHTIGNLISDYIKRKYCMNNEDSNIITYASYKMPHPLTPEIEIKLKLNDNLTNYTDIYNDISKKYKIEIETDEKNIKIDIVKIIFIDTINDILLDITNLIDNFKIEFNKDEDKPINTCSFNIEDEQTYFDHLIIKS